jgi:hypothetical protein
MEPGDKTTTIMYENVSSDTKKGIYKHKISKVVSVQKGDPYLDNEGRKITKYSNLVTMANITASKVPYNSSKSPVDVEITTVEIESTKIEVWKNLEFPSNTDTKGYWALSEVIPEEKNAQVISNDLSKDMDLLKHVNDFNDLINKNGVDKNPFTVSGEYQGVIEKTIGFISEKIGALIDGINALNGASDWSGYTRGLYRSTQRAGKTLEHYNINVNEFPGLYKTHNLKTIIWR